MRNKHIACALVACSLATGILSGCANTPPAAVAQSQEAFAKSMSEAEKVAAASDKNPGIRMYEAIAADNPSRGEPWSKIAQIQFAQGNYSLAIVAAEETLKRDPSNRPAKSVTVVGGLRLAARSLEDLRKDSSFTGDTREDAQRLAVLLRETLGTSVLVPPTEPEAPRVRPKPRPRPAATVATPVTPPLRPDAAASGPAQARPKGGNPFDVLK